MSFDHCTIWEKVQTGNQEILKGGYIKMYNRKTLAQELRAGAVNGRIEEVYGCTAPQTDVYAERLARVAEGFDKTFPENASAEVGLYSAPGRTEIGGNHTDHQWGCVLAASVKFGEEVEIICDGDDENEAINKIVNFLENGE